MISRLLIGVTLCFGALPLFPAENLLRNPDFEERDADGGFPGWSFQLQAGTYAGPVRTVIPFEGRCSLELCCPEVRQSGAVIQRCKVVPGKEYLFGGLFLGRSGFARVNCHDAQGNFLGCAIQRDLTIEEETYTWSALSSSFVPGENVAYVEVIFDMWARICKGSGYADHLYFGEKPATVPNVPAAPSASVEEGRVSLKWKPCVNAVEYIVYRAYFPDQGKGEAVALVTGCAWEDAALDPRASRCIYRVQALDEARQTSGLSAPVEVRIREFPAENATYVGVFSAFQKLRKYAFLPDSPCRKIELDLAANETAACQIVLFNPGRELRKVRVSVDELVLNGVPLTKEQAGVELFQVEYTLVDKPSVLREEMCSLPGWLPDPLLPWEGAMDVPRGENRSIWLKLRTSPACPAGEIGGRVSLYEQGRLVAALPLKATVYPFALPAAPSCQSSFQIRYDRVCEAFGFTEATDESLRNRVFDRYVEMLLDHRLNPATLPYGLEGEKGKALLADPRLVSLSLPTNDFSRLEAIRKRLKEDYGVEGYVYVQDEPGPGAFQACRDTAALVHRNRDVPYILTIAPNPQLFGAVDIWVPSLQDIDWNEVAQRRAAGEHIWWYTSMVPRSPFPTFLVDDCGTSPRALAWLQAKYRIEGLLYWDICMHRRFGGDEESYDGQVWDTPRLYGQANGDGFLVYPGKQKGIDGPVTSIRFEAILEGNEELEYFELYRRLLRRSGCSEEEIERRVEEVIAPAAQSLTRWSADPEVFDRQRRKLAGEICRLLDTP